MLIKRNNPGNIVKGKNKWIGEIEGDNSRFVTFESLPYGYRAMMKLLNTYISRGTNTIEKIIPVYAPASDNNPVRAYIEFVSRKTGIPANQPLIVGHLDTLAKIALAMSLFEHGIRDESDLKELSKAVLNGLQLIVGYTVTPVTKNTTETFALVALTLTLAFVFLSPGKKSA